MPRPDLPAACRRARELLEPYLDGELEPEDRSGLESHLAGCPDCRRERSLADAIRTELRALPELGLPAERLAPFLVRSSGAAGSDPADGPPTAGGEGLRRPHHGSTVVGSRWAWGALAAVLLATAGLALAWLLPQTSSPTPIGAVGPPPRAVAQATAEARLALAYVARAGRRTGLDLRDEILLPHVVDATAHSLVRSFGELPDRGPSPAAQQEPQARRPR